MGSPQELTDQDGNIAWSAQYKAWGEKLGMKEGSTFMCMRRTLQVGCIRWGWQSVIATLAELLPTLSNPIHAPQKCSLITQFKMHGLR
ncbi:RHS domain-containing protein [Pigmentiphaga aceris]|uniref:RHS domain-containing protein n=1 Tax=Pigmentiphaga aceris TaxID=1940612 RepID=UPI001FE46FD9|nr:RHS domain-containing protein [Pigmentiphaga aceris]